MAREDFVPIESTLPERPADLARTPRARRAPAAFEQALLQLVLTCDLAGVTATDVIEASGYSRGSFYRYYADLRDLLERVVSSEARDYVELVSGVMALSADLGNGLDCVSRVAHDLLCHVDEHILFYRALLLPQITSIDLEDFCKRVVAEFRASARFEVRCEHDVADDEFYYFCTTRSFLIYIRYWVEHGSCLSRMQFARQVALMSTPGAADCPRLVYLNDEGRSEGTKRYSAKGKVL